MSVLNTIWSWVQQFFALFVFWLTVFFVLPFKNMEILWILIPIWITLFFTDLYQERRGTPLGNAITNAAIMVWVGIDWIRFLLRANEKGFTWPLFFKYSICVAIMLYALIVVIEGLRGKKIISKIARVRETSYVMLVFSPIIYGIAELSLKYILAILIFSPVFYFFFELLGKVVPNPDQASASAGSSMSGKNYLSQDLFGKRY